MRSYMAFLCGEKKLQIEEVSWADVNKNVMAINKPLYEKIARLQLNKKHKLYKARYRYGDEIVSKGGLGLPISGGGTIPIKNANMPEILKKQLAYKTVPMGLILSKSIEVFCETKRYVIPSKLFTPGMFFGLWEAFDPNPPDSLSNIWNLTAGARTICMLPSISDAILYSKLRREFNLTQTTPPNKLMMHHQLFTELSRHIDSHQQEWFCEVLFFGEEWLNPENNFKELENHLLREAWAQSYNCRTKMDYDIALDDFNEEIKQRNWKPKPNNIAIIKHLLGIGHGIYPAFVPASDDEAAPINFIQDCIVNSYTLKDYYPIIMHTEPLRKNGKIGYFSLSLPTQLEHLDKGRKNSTIVNNLTEIKRMADLLLSMDCAILKFGFFHCDENLSGVILNSCEILRHAPESEWGVSRYKGRKFPFKSPFFKGCISLQRV